MKLHQILDNLLESVPENTTKRMDCPKCRGIHTFSISKIGMSVQYNCFKSSCIFRGSKRSIPSMNALRNHLNVHQSEVKDFSVPTYWIKGIASKKCLSFLFNTNSLQAYGKGLFSVGYDPEQDRLIYFLKDEGKIVGAIGRTLSGKSPKVYNYPTSSLVPFRVGTGKSVVLVEDCASACAIGNIKGYTGMALLGTGMKDEYIPYLKLYDKVIVCLDYDARWKAINLRQTLQYYHKDVCLWILQKDFKDMTKEELQVYED